jgi:hypothetical protein
VTSADEVPGHDVSSHVLSRPWGETVRPAFAGGKRGNRPMERAEAHLGKVGDVHPVAKLGGSKVWDQEAEKRSSLEKAGHRAICCRADVRHNFAEIAVPLARTRRLPSGGWS